MKQLALDIGLSSGPTLQNFCQGPNEAVLKHLALWVGAKTSAASAPAAPFTINAEVNIGRNNCGDGQNQAISSGNGVNHK